MSLDRKPALSHPFDALSADPAPPAAPPRAATPPKAAPSTPPAAAAPVAADEGLVQINVRLPSSIRRELRSAVAGLTGVTGDRWTQDQLVRDALAHYLPTLYADHNGGQPFGKFG